MRWLKIIRIKTVTFFAFSIFSLFFFYSAVKNYNPPAVSSQQALFLLSAIITLFVAAGFSFEVFPMTEFGKNPYRMNGHFASIYGSLPYINKPERTKYKKQLIDAWLHYRKLQLTSEQKEASLAKLKETFDFLIKNQEEQKNLLQEKANQKRDQKFDLFLNSLEKTKEDLKKVQLLTMLNDSLPTEAKLLLKQIQENAQTLLNNNFLSQIERHYLNTLLDSDLPELTKHYHALSEEKRQEKIESTLSLLQELNVHLEQKQIEWEENRSKTSERMYDNKKELIQIRHLSK